MDIASCRQGRWHFPAAGSFASITAQSPTQIAFESGGSTSPKVSGPFDKLRFAQGAIWHGDELRELVAQFDEGSQSWSVYLDRVKCSGGAIAPVPGDWPGVTALAGKRARESVPSTVGEGVR